MSNQIKTAMWSAGGTGHYSCQEDMYMEFFKKHIQRFNGGRVLEIGPGSGEFAHRLINNHGIQNYMVLDLEENIMDSVNYIKDKGVGLELEPVFAQDYTCLFGEEFDLVISNICIPETPKDYREALLNNVIPNCKSAMIIGQLEGKWVEGTEYKDWIVELFNNSFDAVFCELTPYKNCYALIGYQR